MRRRRDISAGPRLQRRAAAAWCRLVLSATLCGCQPHLFVYQPDAVDGGVHLDFTVATPSRADLLFVIDNTGSMASKQAALAGSLSTMLATLGAQDTSYRIGITSTDAYGVVADCSYADNPAVASNTMSDPRSGALGNCQRPEVVLRRPHDGTLGRLIAAYDPGAFSAARFAGYAPAVQAAIAQMVPVAVDGGPVGARGEVGARAVIDRDSIREQACAACGAAACSPGDPTYAACVLPATAAMVQAYFQSNVAGLGIGGFGWAEGLKASMWAIGVDPEEATDAQALAPTYDLLAPTAENLAPALDANGAVVQQGWLRDEAVLAVMYVSDEEDCSMPTAMMEQRSLYEEPTEPTGSICNQPQAQASFLPVARLAALMAARKGEAARVAVGAIAGLSQAGAAGAVGRAALPGDCAPAAASAAAGTACACLASDPDPRWCALTDQPGPGLPACTALSARRYVALANHFARRTFDSICRQGDAAYGAALDDFARVATVSCFALTGTEPVDHAGSNIVVRRSPGGTGSPQLLAAVDAAGTTPGWYYDAVDNRVCLTGLDRTVGDVYDIYVRDTADAEGGR